jgi:hypothetical protein
MSSSFCAFVEDLFAFLEREHCFRIIEQGRSIVVYANESLGVALYYDDQRSFEVSLGLSQRGNPSQPAFSFDEMLRSLNVPANEWPIGYAATTLDAAQKLIGKMAGITSRYAVRLLQGDADSWRQLEEQRRADCVAYSAATNMTHAKRIADAAWSAHDYKKVVSALEAVEAHLGKTDAAKLAYARQQRAR